MSLRSTRSDSRSRPSFGLSAVAVVAALLVGLLLAISYDYDGPASSGEPQREDAAVCAADQLETVASRLPTSRRHHYDDRSQLAHPAARSASCRLAPQTMRQTTILGESMSERVMPFADATGSRTLGFGATADEWAAMTPRQRYRLNDGMLRARIREGDDF